MKANPSPSVVAWVSTKGQGELLTTAITQAEIFYGIERLPGGKRKATLLEAALEVFGRFAEIVLPFDAAAATIYAEIVIRRDRQGVPISGFDAQIGALCRTHHAELATRNEKDFAGIGVETINPWLT
jgi:predicted nucleic acid-binding protein